MLEGFFTNQTSTESKVAHGRCAHAGPVQSLDINHTTDIFALSVNIGKQTSDLVENFGLSPSTVLQSGSVNEHEFLVFVFKNSRELDVIGTRSIALPSWKIGAT